jgi:transcriptional regulator with XRE-family HTH domain
MDFDELERRFLEHLRNLIRRGDLTERGLARLAGISQPHVHNALNGKRTFSREMADTILHALHLDLLDLIEFEEFTERKRRP